MPNLNTWPCDALCTQAKEHHAAVNAELQRSLDLQQQVRDMRMMLLSPMPCLERRCGVAL